MTALAEILFWSSATLLFWAYVGYPLFMATLGRGFLPSPAATPGPVGETVVLVPAYNEERTIGNRIENALELEMTGTLRVVVVSDGSEDGTDRIVAEAAARDPRVVLMRLEGRRGKNACLNAALDELDLDPRAVVVFTDANAMFDASAARHLASRLEAGAACVVGKLTFVEATTGTARAEGLYWRYENRLKRAEGAMGRCVFANGAIFAARAGDVPPLPPDVGNDFWIPVLLLGRGGMVEYVEEAEAREPAAQHQGEEFKRKVRMANRQMTGILKAWKAIDGPTRFQLVSHKLVRWLGLPVMALALLSTLVLVREPLYRTAAALLVLPAVLALASAVLRPLRVQLPLGATALHFMVVHYAAFRGVLQAVRGRRQVTWDAAPSARRVVD